MIGHRLRPMRSQKSDETGRRWRSFLHRLARDRSMPRLLQAAPFEGGTVERAKGLEQLAEHLSTEPAKFAKSDRFDLIKNKRRA